MMTVALELDHEAWRGENIWKGKEWHLGRENSMNSGRGTMVRNP